MSSLPAHLFLCAVRLLEAGEDRLACPAGGLLERTAAAVRSAFFRDLADISRRSTLFEVGERVGLPLREIEDILDRGVAHAALAADLALVRDLAIRSSPSLSFNEGRQVLTGNVGYRIIEANVRELLERPAGQASWC
jgi:predicted DsbA family dithiol-disulfide isomerase